MIPKLYFPDDLDGTPNTRRETEKANDEEDGMVAPCVD